MDKFSEIISRSVKKLEEIRDDLLAASRAIHGDDVDWDKNEVLFHSAKDVDQLRHLLIERTEVKDLGELRTPSVRTRFPGGSYPKYLVRNETLAKVGLTRSGSTYVHRVPKSVVESVVAGLQEFTKEGDTFTTERAVGRIAVPMYQTYIVLAVLSELRLVEPMKRGVFRFVDRGKFVDETKEIWKRLSNALRSMDAAEGTA
jgi:hypothetical protein